MQFSYDLHSFIYSFSSFQLRLKNKFFLCVHELILSSKAVDLMLIIGFLIAWNSIIIHILVIWRFDRTHSALFLGIFFGIVAVLYRHAKIFPYISPKLLYSTPILLFHASYIRARILVKHLHIFLLLAISIIH